jgi:hypothetical protein
MQQLYFCLSLSSNEHWIVAEQIEEFCSKNDITVHYAGRKLKEGHFAGYREYKLSGKDLGPTKGWLKKEYLHYIKPNPYKKTLKYTDLGEKCRLCEVVCFGTCEYGMFW